MPARREESCSRLLSKHIANMPTNNRPFKGPDFHIIRESPAPSEDANKHVKQQQQQHPQNKSNIPSKRQATSKQQEQLLSEELKAAIKHMVANISKSFIVDWYASISPTNHDFVASCESLIEEVLLKLVELIVEKIDKYKVGQLVTTLLHEHVLNDSAPEKRQSIEHQIDNYEYDICQSSVVRLFGLLSNENLRRVVFTIITDTRAKLKNDLNRQRTMHDSTNRHYQPQRQQHQYQNMFPTRRPAGTYPKSFSFEDIILSASEQSSSSSLGSSTSSSNTVTPALPIKTTSALYTLVIAMLTKAAFMPIINSISEPKWLYAVIIWLCKKEEREKAKRQQDSSPPAATANSNHWPLSQPQFVGRDMGNKLSATSIIVTNTRGSRTLDLEEGIDVASANINFNNPICGSLKRPLDNIEIFATEEVKSQNSCYVLYCIRYDGLCYRHPSASGFSFIPDQPDVPIIDKRQTHSVRRRNDTNVRPTTSSNMTNEEQDISNRKSFRKCMTIKRRFREFVLLQLRLEENPKIRPYMKNIPKPTKLKAATQNIFSLPGINNIKLDQSTIKLRQRFLERFLVALNSSPFIANSYEFKEFFSYNVNPVGVSKSKSTILQVNLNKVFVDSVRSAFSIIRSTLPGDDYQSLNSNSKSNPDAWLTELQQSTLKLHVQTRTSHSKMNLERYIDSKLLLLGESPTRSSSLERQSEQAGAFAWMGGSRGGSLKSNMAKSRVGDSSGSNSNSSPLQMSRSSSNNSNQPVSSLSGGQSKSDSSESIYHDASSLLHAEQATECLHTSGHCNSIQICDTYPIASKFIDIIHFSISRDAACSKSALNFVARLLLGRLLERYAIQMIDAALTLKNASFCINGITSSIWDESDEPPLDLEGASLDEAVIHLSRLVEDYAPLTLVPRKLLRTLISKQLRFYLSQLESQKRNKFVIYSFFVHLLDELEIVDQHDGRR